MSSQSVEVVPDWWNAALLRRGLPGEVTGAPAGGGRARISRGRIFDLASQASSADDWLNVLWSALAWGAGTSARNMDRRLDAIAHLRRDAIRGLVESAELSREEPKAAYEALRPAGNLIRWLGPAFFSKFLYFAGAGRPDHPCLILDARVAKALHLAGWSSLHPGGAWPAGTYERYCELLSRWANDSDVRGTAGRPVAADELELWLFTNG